MFSLAVLKEAGALLAASLLLGLSYNSFSEKGIFGPTQERTPVPPVSNPGVSSELIPVEVAKSLFDSGDALFVDTRHAYDFGLGHIRGAINIPLKGADMLLGTLSVDRNKTVVVYCDGAECNSSPEVGAKFIMAGFKDVRIFFSGWRAWKELDYPTETESK